MTILTRSWKQLGESQEYGADSDLLVATKGDRTLYVDPSTANIGILGPTLFSRETDADWTMTHSSTASVGHLGPTVIFQVERCQLDNDPL